MDMKCATCQEPWEHQWLLLELPFDIWDGEEGSKSHKVVRRFELGAKVKIPDELREGLSDNGWKFGRTIVAVLECCCCAGKVGEGESDEDVTRRKELRLEAEELLGEDLDGLISTLSSIDMYAGM